MKAKTSSMIWAMALLTAPCGSQAQLELKPEELPQPCFSGEARTVRVTWHNAGEASVTADLHWQLFQTSSATAAPLGEPRAWKSLQVLPGQTVLEPATIAFPAVRGETRFLVRWLDGTNKSMGTTEVLVYPLDLLKELGTLTSNEPPGVLDPDNVLKPLLKAVSVGFIDLEETSLDEFRGKLAILGPFASRERMQAGLGRRVETIAKRGVAVVWLQPPPEPWHELKPSFYVVPEGRGVVVVAQAELVAQLAGNPQAQFNLLQFAGLALHPEPARLPRLNQ